ncbi:hypothetical protein AB0F91_36275 [Amycolatopsis sp. NPDC023774]|uniref:hypothetical protein n=1 Tax=Amycolatopsis sp. NPDC023774 TaxID=3155015 RepID=UPI0033D40DA6
MTTVVEQTCLRIAGVREDDLEEAFRTARPSLAGAHRYARCGADVENDRGGVAAHGADADSTVGSGAEVVHQVGGKARLVPGRAVSS